MIIKNIFPFFIIIALFFASMRHFFFLKSLERKKPPDVETEVSLNIYSCGASH